MILCPLRDGKAIADGLCRIGRSQHLSECEDHECPVVVGPSPKKTPKEKNAPPMYPYTEQCKKLHHSATITGRACNTCRVLAMMERIHAKQEANK